MITSSCCGRLVSRTREERNFAYFQCYGCGSVQRIRLHLPTGPEGINQTEQLRSARESALDEKVSELA